MEAPNEDASVNTWKDNRTDTRASDTLHVHLLLLNRQTFAAGRYVTAYHALAAAMYHAAESGDAQGLHEVTVVAREQAAWVATHLSTLPSALQSVGTHGRHNPGETLRHEANARLRRLTHVPPHPDQ